MKVAMIGLGKLGLPVSCAMVQCGHEVYGYDADEAKAARFAEGKCDYYEPDIEAVLENCLSSGLRIVDSVNDAVAPSEIIFVAVPTPSLFSGAFDTSIVADALRAVADAMARFDDYKVVAVISTVLPGTMRNEFLPVLTERLGPPGARYGFCYNAQFIAMGTAMRDTVDPEYVLVGEYDERSGNVLGAFYNRLTDSPILRMTIENAEIIKMIYNTFIGQKILFANTILEICDKVPHAHCDVVADAVRRATDRLISGRYLKGGLGDGGSCHPRDQLALAFFANEIGLSANPFRYISQTRLEQTRYIASVVAGEHFNSGLPVAVLGLTFKAGTDLIDDSPALLLVECLAERGVVPRSYDPIVKPEPLPERSHVYVLATPHEVLRDFPFAPGSVVVDPWRFLEEAPDGCRLRRVGVGANPELE